MTNKCAQCGEEMEEYGLTTHGLMTYRCMNKEIGYNLGGVLGGKGRCRNFNLLQGANE